MYSAPIRSLCSLIAAVAAGLTLGWGSPAAAQDNRFAADHYEPAVQGSRWFANESLGFRDGAPFHAGVVSSYGERLFVVRDVDGHKIVSPLRNDEVLHLGASLVLLDYLRLEANFPVHLLTSGRSGAGYRSPDREQGIGDLRFGADVRVLGQDNSPFRLGVGAQFWAPTGDPTIWASDDSWRVRPRVMIAGETKWILWALQAGMNFRDRRIGTEIGLSGAVGLRAGDRFSVGPELFLSRNLTQGFLETATSPFELMLGAHLRLTRHLRVGAGISRGFSQAFTDPDYRVLGTLSMIPIVFAPPPSAPRPPPVILPRPAPVIHDSDHDGVPDDQDACPGVAGIAQPEPSQNGCPPDTDGDGINDLGDACPTQPGPATDDPATTGCPQAK